MSVLMSRTRSTSIKDEEKEVNRDWGLFKSCDVLYFTVAQETFKYTNALRVIVTVGDVFYMNCYGKNLKNANNIQKRSYKYIQ